jgi:hypothetical protein
LTQTKDRPTYSLTSAQVEEVKRIQQQLRGGKCRFATDEEMAALWKKVGISK